MEAHKTQNGTDANYPSEEITARATFDNFLEFARTMRDKKARPLSISAVTCEGDEYEFHYFFEVDRKIHILEITSREKSLPSLFSLFPSADFIEREIFTIFNIRFIGHPNLGK